MPTSMEGHLEVSYASGLINTGPGTPTDNSNKLAHVVTNAANMLTTSSRRVEPSQDGKFKLKGMDASMPDVISALRFDSQENADRFLEALTEFETSLNTHLEQASTDSLDEAVSRFLNDDAAANQLADRTAGLDAAKRKSHYKAQLLQHCLDIYDSGSAISQLGEFNIAANTFNISAEGIEHLKAIFGKLS